MSEHTAFITGGSRGLGEAIVNVFRREGVNILSPTRAELDLADTNSIRHYLEGNDLSKVDILINNAGINFPEPLDQLQLKNWQQTLQINLTAPFLLLQSIGQQMAKRRWGRVVQISSILGTTARAGRAAYSSTKAGLNALTRDAALEWGAHGVLVNSLAPGFVDSPLTRQNNTPAAIEAMAKNIPVARLAQPAEIAEVVYFLASDRNTYLTGQTILVDGGFSCV